MKDTSQTLAGRAQPLGNYPHLKRVGNLIFVSGTSSRRPDNTHRGANKLPSGEWQLDIREQTHGVMENVKGILEAVGLGLSDIVDVTTFLVNMRDFKGYNEVYGLYFTENAPTRTTVAVSELPHPNLLIEIKVIAWANSALVNR